METARTAWIARRLPLSEVVRGTRQMRVRHRLGENGDDRIAADIRAAPCNLAAAIEHDAISLGIAPGEPGLAREGLRGRIGIGCPLGKLAAGDAADQRHDDVLHQRVDDLVERGADDDADGQIDDAALEGEFPKLAGERHGSLP